MANNQVPPCPFSTIECLQWWAFTPVKESLCRTLDPKWRGCLPQGGPIPKLYGIIVSCFLVHHQELILDLKEGTLHIVFCHCLRAVRCHYQTWAIPTIRKAVVLCSQLLARSPLAGKCISPPTQLWPDVPVTVAPRLSCQYLAKALDSDGTPPEERKQEDILSNQMQLVEVCRHYAQSFFALLASRCRGSTCQAFNDSSDTLSELKSIVSQSLGSGGRLVTSICDFDSDDERRDADCTFDAACHLLVQLSSCQMPCTCKLSVSSTVIKLCLAQSFEVGLLSKCKRTGAGRPRDETITRNAAILSVLICDVLMFAFYLICLITLGQTVSPASGIAQAKLSLSPWLLSLIASTTSSPSYGIASSAVQCLLQLCEASQVPHSHADTSGSEACATTDESSDSAGIEDQNIGSFHFVVMANEKELGILHRASYFEVRSLCMFSLSDLQAQVHFVSPILLFQNENIHLTCLVPVSLWVSCLCCLTVPYFLSCVLAGTGCVAVA